MANYNTFKIDEIKTKLANGINRNVAIIEKLKSIELVTKKDGKPFKNLAQNFTNCKIGYDGFSLHSDSKSLRVYFMVGYKHDYYNIDLYNYCDTLEDGDERKAPNNGILRSIYIYSVDETKSLIDSTIKQLEKQTASYKMQLNNCDKIAKSFLKKQSQLIDELEKNCGGKNSLYYSLKDINIY